MKWLVWMNETINKFLLTEDKSMPKLHLSNYDLLILLADHSINIMKGFKISIKKVDLNYIYKNESDSKI